MKKKHQILKVIDKSDNYGKKKDLLFDIPFRVLITARSQQGKTTLITNFLLNPNFYLNDFDKNDIWIISPSITNDEKLKVIIEEKDIDESHLMTDYNEDVVKELYDMLEEEYEQAVADNIKPKNKLIIMDDLGFSGALRNKRMGQISRIACNGRHINLSLFVCVQQYSQASPTLRSNINGLIVFDTSKKNLDAVAEENNYLKKDADFVKMFRDNVKDKRDFMVINYTNPKRTMYLNKDFEPIDINKYLK
ncbi:MAG: hypothetical protein CMI60_03885 [Parvibaculum sp.]|nr:hypothetical protein [Parvibaculum sp.]